MAEIFGGIVILVIFGFIETRVAHPMFRLSLFRIRAFTAGNVASFLASLSRGGLMFMLIIWLQGIWLPLHGYSFSQTPLWAGIYMIPLTVGFLLAGPVSGVLADRYGARPFATGGLLLVALTFILLLMLPVDFSYWALRRPHLPQLGRDGHVHRAQPDRHHEQPAGQTSAGRVPVCPAPSIVGPGPVHRHLLHPYDPRIGGHPSILPLPRPHRPRRRPATALRVSHLPPVGSLFAAFLGYNPMQTLLGPATLSHLPATAHYLTSRAFFPHSSPHPSPTG